MCSNFRERVSMPMLDGVLSLMEKRPTINRLGETRPRPLMRPTPAVAAEQNNHDVVRNCSSEGANTVYRYLPVIARVLIALPFVIPGLANLAPYAPTPAIIAA